MAFEATDLRSTMESKSLPAIFVSVILEFWNGGGGGDSVQCDKFQKEGKTNRMKTLLKCGRKKFGKGSSRRSLIAPGVVI